MNPAEARALRQEVGDLREEVDSLRTELGRVRRAVSDLRLGGSLSDSRSLTRQAIEEESEDSYSVVSETPSRSFAAPGSPLQVPAAGATTSLPASSASIGGGSGIASPLRAPVLSWPERLAIADQIAGFIERSLAGGHRGNSGREKNPLQSRYWVVIRDYAGQIYSPVKVFTRWGSAKDLVKKVHDCGDSIFIGFPTEQEGKRSIEGAGLIWPAHFEQ